jgi:hypothetical protein
VGKLINFCLLVSAKASHRSFNLAPLSATTIKPAHQSQCHGKAPDDPIAVEALGSVGDLS